MYAIDNQYLTVETHISGSKFFQKFQFYISAWDSGYRSETKAQQVNPTRGDNFKILWPRRLGAPLFWPHPSYFYILVRRNIYQSLFQIQSAADSLRDTAAETRWDLKLRSRSNWRLMKTKLTLLKVYQTDLWFSYSHFLSKTFFSKYRVLIFIRLFVGRKILIKIGRIST